MHAASSEKERINRSETLRKGQILSDIFYLAPSSPHSLNVISDERDGSQLIEALAPLELQSTITGGKSCKVEKKRKEISGKHEKLKRQPGCFHSVPFQSFMVIEH